MLRTQTPAPEVRAADPSPLLRLIAGDYAARVAELWPAPHGAYLEMPSQRRHLTHVVLDFASAPRAAMAQALQYARADAVARDFLGALPPGFVRLLGRLGEVAWAGEDYLRLVALFHDADAALVLRQTPALTADQVRALDALAPPLRAPALVRHLADPVHAALLDEAWRALRDVRGEDAARAAAARWARARDAARLLEMAAADMAPQRFDPAPFPAHADLRRFGGTATLADAGRRFRNCLAAYGERAAEGFMALYEWAGPPPAALALARDGFFGWRLEEARGVGNTILEPPARDALIDTLRSLGVRVGRPGRDLRDRLRRAAGDPHVWVDDGETELTAFGL